MPVEHRCSTMQRHLPRLVKEQTMPTALQVLELKALSLASGFGKWTVARRGDLSGSHGNSNVAAGSAGWDWNLDTTPAKTKLFSHDPKVIGVDKDDDGEDREITNLGRQMMHASMPEVTLFTKALKLGWFPWQPGDECRGREFKAATVEKLRTGANKLTIGNSAMGCKFCRQEPLAEADTPIEVDHEFKGGVSVTKLPEDHDPTPFRESAEIAETNVGTFLKRTTQVDLGEATFEEIQRELERRRAEVETSVSAITEESRAVVEPGAPTGLTELPSDLPTPTPPAATKPMLSECPGCGKPGKGKSAKKRSSSVYAHFRSYPEHAETPIGVPA